MIVHMRKYRVLVHQESYPAFLEALAVLGIAHVETIRHDAPEAASQSLQRMQLFRTALNLLSAEAPSTPVAPFHGSAEDLAVEIEREHAAIVQHQQQLNQLETRASGWTHHAGSLPVSEIEKLAAKGVHFYLFSCSKQAFDRDWKKEYLLEVIWEEGDMLGFVVVSENTVQLPQKAGETWSVADLSAWAADWQKHQRLLDAAKNRLQELSQFRSMLEEALATETDALQWAHVAHHTDTPGEGGLRLLGMYVPVEKATSLESLLNQQELLWEGGRPGPADEVPILLSNKRFSRLFHPIGDLFSLPSYQEMDLTPFFAPFFTLFFGMCLGDVGYGLVMVIALWFFRKHPALASQKGVVRLGLILGSAAVGFGMVTGTVFGASLAEWPAMEAVKSVFLDVNELFTLSLLIGIAQILFAMGLRVYNRSRMYGFQYGLSTLGWMLGIVSGGFMYLLPDHAWVAKAGIWLGVALIMLFSDPDKKLLGRLGLGLWELYGITGLFGDVLSYVRLFALGLSSGILGLVINNVAFSLLEGPPVISWLLFAAVLLVGHGLNLAIATLSAFVHPVRLTFVEFYKNAGFLGGGKPYQPFRKSKQTNSI